MFVEAQLLALFILGILTVNTINNKILKIFLNLLFSTFFILQIISYYITSELIDYRFFIHSDISLFKTYYFQFKKELVYLLILFLLINYIFFKIKIKKLITFKKSYFLLILIFFLIIFLPNKGVIKKLYEVNKIFNKSILYKKKNDEENIKVSYENFIKDSQLDKLISKKSLVAEKKFNIIYLILESVDYGLISGFPNLTPNLNNLFNEWNFHKISEIDGCNWTIGSIYCLMTGLPSFFPFEGNKIFHEIDKINLVTVGDILKKSEYEFQEFYIGEANFTGTRDLLETMNFRVFDYNNSTADYEVYPNSFGYHDKDLFYELKKRIGQLNKNKNSFAIFGTTINTHLNGIKDDRMDQFIGTNYENNLEHSIKALDYLIGDFIKFLEKEDLFKNTVIFISPDHTLPKNKSINKTNKKIKDKDRSLYLLSNKDINNNKELTQIELPKLLLNTADIKHNHKFFYELNKYVDLKNYVKKNKSNFSKFNNSIVNFKKSPIQTKILIENNNLKIINDGIENYKLKLLDNSPSYINLLFDNNLIFKNDNFTKESKKPRKISKEDEEFSYNILTIFKNNNNIISAKILSANEKLIFQIPLLNNEVLLNINDYKNKINLSDYLKNKNRFIAHAGGSIANYKYLNALEALEENYSKGLRLFELDLQLTSDNFIVATHDWESWKKMSGFKGNTPPTLNEFNKYKILDKFTALDYIKINSWFEKNKDAILITDKIYNLDAINNQLKINKERIIVETFSEDSSIIFLKNGYKIIANIDFLKNMNDPIKFLKKNNIKNISVSQRIKSKLENNFINYLKSFYKINLEKKLLNNGFRFYAFNLNDEKDKITEKDILCDYKQFFYGMYVDKWDFNKSLVVCGNRNN